MTAMATPIVRIAIVCRVPAVCVEMEPAIPGMASLQLHVRRIATAATAHVSRERCAPAIVAMARRAFRLYGTTIALTAWITMRTDLKTVPIRNAKLSGNAMNPPTAAIARIMTSTDRWIAMIPIATAIPCVEPRYQEIGRAVGEKQVPTAMVKSAAMTWTIMGYTGPTALI